MIEQPSANPNPYFGKTGLQSNYNWVGVLEFLQVALLLRQNEYQKNNDRENTWLLEKKTLQARVSELEGELKAADIIAKDLLKRNKMLEFSLKQERYLAAHLGSRARLLPKFSMKTPTQSSATYPSASPKAIRQLFPSTIPSYEGF